MVRKDHFGSKSLALILDLATSIPAGMRGTTQHFWKHQIAKSSKTLGPRINLTFRVIVG